jgi:hypothetical protein
LFTKKRLHHLGSVYVDECGIKWYYVKKVKEEVFKGK